MIKSRRKLKPMKVVGAKVYDPMPRNPTTVARARSRDGRVFFARSVTTIHIDIQTRKSRVLKNGTRRIIYK